MRSTLCLKRKLLTAVWGLNWGSKGNKPRDQKGGRGAGTGALSMGRWWRQLTLRGQRTGWQVGSPSVLALLLLGLINKSFPSRHCPGVGGGGEDAGICGAGADGA